ncbi:LysR family transcriptional regulator [Thalassotalea sp. M1531]|uniref:LysR family transcriptional regulator n=1 Tax=Thalassotalea algicola TaxID=2716224 RepID=A0A7Y0Q7N9_9GAMM|nr:LysR family transcriptional regulator [Thalassotalea algicola]NMP33274.1 LysR family transcriptional regulator [Thalassotalea algicola]
MNWDDIKIFLEVARTEKLTEASKRLSKDVSTVSRRLHKLEESLSTQLFERTTDGHRLTDDGKALLCHAQHMEINANQALSQIKDNNADNSGLVRIGLTEAFGNFFIAPNIHSLQNQHPNLAIDLINFTRDVKITRNEADIAIALEMPKSSSVIGTKLCDYRLQLYGHQRYLHEQALTVNSANLSNQRWVSYVDELMFTEQLSYLKEIATEITPVYRSNSVVSQHSAIKSGVGIGILPCFLADQDPSLIKLCANEINIKRSFYLITHPESKRLPRVALVWEFLKQLAKNKQSQLMPN